MKLWIDDVRPAPEGQDYIICKTVNDAKRIIQYCETMEKYYEMILEVKDLPERVRKGTEKDLQEITLSLISIDHDAGDYGPPDYIKLLDWLEETGRNYPIHIHSANAVGVANMRAIIERNGWKEVK